MQTVGCPFSNALLGTSSFPTVSSIETNENKQDETILIFPICLLSVRHRFRSAFIPDEDLNDRRSTNDFFISFSVRLLKLLERKLQSLPSTKRNEILQMKTSKCPLLRLRKIDHITDLYPFFHCLTRMHTYDHHHYQHSLPSQNHSSHKQQTMPKHKDSSKKKNKSSMHPSVSLRKLDSNSNSSFQEETISEIETSVLEDFVESWI